MTVQPNAYFFLAEEILAANVTVGPPDAENQVYDVADAPFALGAEVWDDGHVFRSLVEGNNAALTDAASWVDLGEVDGGALKWVAGTYAENATSILNSRIWKSVEGGNAETPGSGSKWVDIGPTNRFRAFDLMFNRPAESIGEIKWVFSMPQSINAITIVLPKGAFCEVIINDAEDEEVYNETIRLTLDSGGGPYNHDFSPIDTVSRVILHALPPGTGKTISIRIYGAASSVVSAGQIGMGFAYDIGTAIVGSRVSIVNFKDPVENEFGIVSFSNRPIRRVVEFRLRNISSQTDRTLTRMSRAITQPVCVYMVDGVEFGMMAYGYARAIDLGHDTRMRTGGFIEVKGFAEK